MSVIDIRLWLSTFHNQRQLVHQASVLVSISLLVAGFTSFAYQGYADVGKSSDFDGSRRRIMLSWVTGVVGMIATVINQALWRQLTKVARLDPLATEEQMSVRRTNTTIMGCIGLSAVAVSEAWLFLATQAVHFTMIATLAAIAVILTLVTVGYDVAYLVRPNRINLDDPLTLPPAYDEFDP